MREVMLTTIDNPFDPFEDEKNWFEFDLLNGYNCAGYLARIANTSDELPEEYNKQLIEEAIDEIVKENVSGVYRKVVRE